MGSCSTLEISCADPPTKTVPTHTAPGLIYSPSVLVSTPWHIPCRQAADPILVILCEFCCIHDSSELKTRFRNCEATFNPSSAVSMRTCFGFWRGGFEGRRRFRSVHFSRRTENDEEPGPRGWTAMELGFGSRY